jgi:glycosyltransferase involved in cell wall biosynthesis
VGGGPQESRLKELIQELGIQDRFLMTGWRADAREIIQVFDIFVSTSIRESFGNGLIEAALAGKPVIAPRVDGIPEAVIDQATGLLLTPTGSFESRKDDSSSPVPEKVLIDDKFEPPRSLNPHQLADRILYLLQKPVLRNELGRAARRRASIKFSMKRYITDLENIYMELLDEKLT